MAKIRQSNLDEAIVTGLTDLGANVASGDFTLIYDASSGTLKKISQTNLLNFPNISSVSPTNVLTGDGTGNVTFTITGTNFTGTSAKLLTAAGADVAFDSVTVDSSTQITGVIAKSSLSNANEPYDVRVTAASGLQSTLENQININAQPVYITASGSLGSQPIGTAGSFSVNATDPESAGNVTFELYSGSLPPGYSITNTSANGGTAIISGTDSTTSSTTTFNFVLRATDAASNTSTRAFSIQSRVLVSESFTSSGTFSVPSGITQTDVLVVAGGGSGASANSGSGVGGGGAGGLIFMPNYPLTPGGTITVTVGNGGPNTTPSGGTDTNGYAGQDSVFGSPSDPGLGQGGVLTAKGGGKGDSASACGGGSGGGGGSFNGTGGPATQPTQPGNSGTYGFGNPGGTAGSNQGPGQGAGGGGGGGAGAAGGNGVPNASNTAGGAGGAGKAYTIADGTTPVYYAGGGGGSAGTKYACAPSPGGAGGQGGGTAGSATGQTQCAGANKGGGSGGARAAHCSGAGGKGIVIVRY